MPRISGARSARALGSLLVKAIEVVEQNAEKVPPQTPSPQVQRCRCEKRLSKITDCYDCTLKDNPSKLLISQFCLRCKKMAKNCQRNCELGQLVLHLNKLKKQTVRKNKKKLQKHMENRKFLMKECMEKNHFTEALKLFESLCEQESLCKQEEK